MKKIVTTVLALTMAMGLTACNDIASPAESISNMSNSLKNSTSAIYTDAAQNETESTSISELENDTSGSGSSSDESSLGLSISESSAEDSSVGSPPSENVGGEKPFIDMRGVYGETEIRFTL